MAKVKEVYVCSNCGYETPKWNGRCPSCGEWNTFEQQLQAASAGKTAVASAVRTDTPTKISEIDTESEIR